MRNADVFLLLRKNIMFFRRHCKIAGFAARQSSFMSPFSPQEYFYKCSITLIYGFIIVSILKTHPWPLHRPLLQRATEFSGKNHSESWLCKNFSLKVFFQACFLYNAAFLSPKTVLAFRYFPWPREVPFLVCKGGAHTSRGLRKWVNK